MIWAIDENVTRIGGGDKACGGAAEIDGETAVSVATTAGGTIACDDAAAEITGATTIADVATGDAENDCSDDPSQNCHTPYLLAKLHEPFGVDRDVDGSSV